MKVVSSSMGIAAVRISPDDVVPARGILQRDLAEFVGRLYNFSVRPVIESGTPLAANPIFLFQSGAFTSEKQTTPIAQLIMFPDGYAIFAQDTDLADAALTDLLAQLDSRLGFRFAAANLGREYASLLVVEFDRKFVEQAAFIELIQKSVNEVLGGNSRRYRLKRISFGIDATNEVALAMTPPASLSHVIRPDFLIERRVNEPLERNRFFCSAPLATAEHAKLLERVERAAID